MTITDFSLLKTTDQLALLHAEGIYLAKRKVGSRTVLLYQINDVYVEIHYTKYRRFVDYVYCSQQIDILDPYLEAISLEEVLGCMN